MKIITWNINGYRAITGQNSSRRFDVLTNDNKLFSYIDKEKPDLIALQETKAEVEQINDELLAPEGYFYYYNSSRAKKGYSGVVTFCKKEPKQVRYGFGIEELDREGRVVETIFDDFVHFNIYFPNGQQNDERLQYKLDFYKALYQYLKDNYSDKDRIIVSGDYNTAHNEIDLARPKQNEQTSGFLRIERDLLDDFVNTGYIDSFREINKEPDQYSWWSNRGRARENNVGWRIDYHFLSPALKNSIKHCEMQQSVMGSDHCPVVLDLDI